LRRLRTPQKSAAVVAAWLNVGAALLPKPIEQREQFALVQQRPFMSSRKKYSQFQFEGGSGLADKHLWFLREI